MKKLFSFVLISAFVLSIVSLASCKKDSNSSTVTTSSTLYDTLGGTTKVQDPQNASVMIEKGRLGIRSVVDSAIFVIAADTAINSYFSVLLSEVSSGNLSGFQALSKNLTDFFCVATGAKDFTYTGKSMVAAHDPAQNPRINMKVANDDFDEFIKDLVIAARKNSIPDAIIGRLGAITNTVRSQVVQR